MPDLSFRVKAEDDTHGGLASAHRELDTLSEKSERASESTGGLEGALTKLGVAAAGVGAVMGAKEFLGDSVGAAENLAQSVSKLQRTIGGTTEDASRLKFALGESIGAVGGNADNANMALGRFAKGLSGLIENEDGTTTKSNALTKQLEAMGITSKDAAGNALPMKDVLGQLADKFKDMPDGAEKTALAMQLFGRQGVDLIPFLNKGSDGIAEMEKESDKLGLTLSANTIQQTQKLAAAQRTFGEAMEGVKVQIGVALLPLLTAMAEKATQLATFIASNVVPAVRDFANWIGPQLTPSIDQAQKLIAQIVPQVVSFAEQLGQKLVPVIQQVVQWLTQHKEVLALVAVTIGTLVAGPIAAFIAAAVLVAQHWAEIQPVVQRFVEFVQTVVIPAIQHWINDVFMPRFEALKQYITVEFLPKFQAALTNIKDIVTEVVQWIVDHWTQIHAVIQPFIDVTLPLLKGQFLAAKDVIETVMAAIKDIISVVLDVISGNWSGAWKDMQKLLSDIWTGIQSVVHDALAGLQGALDAAWTAINGAATAAWNGIWTAIQGAWGDIQQAVSDGISKLETLIEALPGQIVGWLGDLAQLLYQAGVDLIQGLINGVESKAKDLGDTIGGLAGKAKKAFTDPLSIFSPSKVMAGVGEDFVQGFIDGALGRTGALSDAVAKLAKTASDGFSTGLGGGQLSAPGSQPYTTRQGIDPETGVLNNYYIGANGQTIAAGPAGGGSPAVGGGGLSRGNGTDSSTIGGNKKQYYIDPSGNVNWFWLYSYNGGGNSRPLGQGIYEWPGGYDTAAQAQAAENNGGARGSGSSGGGGTNGVGVNNAPGFTGASVPFPTNLPAAAPFPDIHGIAVGIANSGFNGIAATASRGVAGGTLSYSALAARWGLEHNPALGRMLDGTEAGAQRAVQAFFAASGMGGGSAGPDWSAPIAAGSGIAPSVSVGSGIPAAPIGGGGVGSVGPTVVFQISAMDASSFQTSMPNLIRQADLYLKGHGQVGLLK